MFLSNIYFFAQTVMSQAASAKFKQSAEKKTPVSFHRDIFITH